MSDSAKKELRRRALVLRGDVSFEEKARTDLSICDSILSLPEWKAASLVLVYASCRGEIDLGRIYAVAQRDGKATAFPRCLPHGVMEFVDCRYEDCSIGRFGILEPPRDTNSIEAFPADTLCILPCLSANRKGFRIGYGGGYYDRFLTSHHLTTVAALHHRFLINDEGFEEPFDIPADILITEKEIVRVEK